MGEGGSSGNMKLKNKYQIKCVECESRFYTARGLSNHLRYGCHSSKEYLSKIAEEKRIKKLIPRKGVPHTEEYKLLMHNMRVGEKNPMWGGNNVKKQAGNDRARRLFKNNKCPCEVCNTNKVEIHHKDSNPLNNDVSNISWLCRKHHMEIDGRMEKLHIASRKSHLLNGRWSINFNECRNCGTSNKNHRARGLCESCYKKSEYYY